MTDERRGAPRVDKRFMVKYRCPAMGQHDWMLSPIRDLSAKGIRFIGEFGFTVGSVLELQLCLPTVDQPLAVGGTVVWAQPATAKGLTEHGVSFAEQDVDAKQQVERATEFFLRRQRG